MGDPQLEIKSLIEHFQDKIIFGYTLKSKYMGRQVK